MWLQWFAVRLDCTWLQNHAGGIVDRPADDFTWENSLQPASHVSKSSRELASPDECGLPEDGIKCGPNDRPHVSTHAGYPSRHQLRHPTMIIRKCIIIAKEEEASGATHCAQCCEEVPLRIGTS